MKNMCTMTWKQRHAIQVPKPRMLRPMRAKPAPLGCKAQRNATSARYKPEKPNPKRDESATRGHMKIMKLLDRGIRLSS